jgi:hypothetical protein
MNLFYGVVMRFEHVGQWFSKGVPRHTSVPRVLLGVPRNFGCYVTADKIKFINNFV